MTDPLTGLRAEMAAYLRESPLLEGIAIREEFPGGYKGVPTRQACVAVGISGVERAAAPGGRVKLTLRFDILCPPGGNPAAMASSTGCAARSFSRRTRSARWKSTAGMPRSIRRPAVSC